MSIIFLSYSNDIATTFPWYFYHSSNDISIIISMIVISYLWLYYIIFRKISMTYSLWYLYYILDIISIMFLINSCAIWHNILSSNSCQSAAAAWESTLSGHRSPSHVGYHHEGDRFHTHSQLKTPPSVQAHRGQVGEEGRRQLENELNPGRGQKGGSCGDFSGLQNTSAKTSPEGLVLAA